MAIKIRSSLSESDYILMRDRESDNPTVFAYRQLSYQEMEQVAALSPMSMAQAYKITEIMGDTPSDKLSPEQSDQITKLADLPPIELMRRMKAQAAKVCQFGLLAIRNIVDEKTGNPVELSTADFIRFSDPSDLKELAQAIMSSSKLSGDDAKKSNSQPAPGSPERAASNAQTG